MADEQNTNPEPQAPQVSEIEQRAMEQGWVPQEEWSGEPEGWRPAKEFLDRGELFKKIDDQKRELKQLRQTMEEFGKHHAQVKELAYKQAIADLKAQKKLALEEGDAEAVVEIDDKIAETREKQRVAEAAPKQVVAQPTGPDPDFVRWEARNSWYKTDRAMKVFADDIARELIGRGEQDKARILAEVDRQVRKEFASKFENPNRNKAGAVEVSTKGRTSREEVVMTDAEKAIMNKFVRQGVITKEKYLEEFKARQAG